MKLASKSMVQRALTYTGLPHFFVKKPKIFKNVKSKRGGQFSEKPDSARVNHNFQKFSDLGHKNMFAISIITMSMIQHHLCLIIINEKLINF